MKTLEEQVESLTQQVEQLNEESELDEKLIGAQSKLLSGVVNAVRGEPPAMTLWSHSDAVELVQKMAALVEEHKLKDFRNALNQPK